MQPKKVGFWLLELLTHLPSLVSSTDILSTLSKKASDSSLDKNKNLMIWGALKFMVRENWYWYKSEQEALIWNYSVSIKGIKYKVVLVGHS